MNRNLLSAHSKSSKNSVQKLVNVTNKKTPFNSSFLLNQNFELFFLASFGGEGGLRARFKHCS